MQWHEQQLLRTGTFHRNNVAKILTNLLDIVKERAEAAEDELERVFTETNETRASSISSDKSAAPIVIHGDNISVGSDDVFDGSPADRSQLTAFWEEQFKKRIRSLETLLAEERNKVSYLESRLNLVGSDVISSAMSDDAKLQVREKELLQSELRDSQKHATFANDQIRSLTEKLKKAETDRRGSPKVHRRLAHEQGATTDEYSEVEPYCKTCAELQSVKNQLSDELISFKTKAEELEVMIDDVTQKNEMWVSKFNAAEQDKQLMEQKFGTKVQETKRLEDQLSKIREEDRMKDIFLKERDNNIKDKTNQIARKEELIQEQEDIIRQREEDMQELFDKISQRERTIKELKEAVAEREERIKEKDEQLHKLSSHLEEKTEELHFLEEEVQEAVLKRKESESTIAELELKIEETLKSEKNEIETENERLQSDVDNLMSNLSELHQDKQTLQNELDKAKQALSEAMLMWERDRSYLGTQLNITNEKLRLYESTAEKKDSHAIQTLRREVHAILETREKLVHELKLQKMEHDNTVRILKTEKFKLTEELTSKIRMLTHEMTNNDKMSDELVKLRGQDEINYQLHHSEKLLKAELLAMKVRYETQLDRLQKEHLQLLEVVERLQRETHFDKEIIVGVQKGMANIRDNYTQDLSRWKDERSVLESHITQIEEGKEIAQHLRAQIDALRRQLMDQDVERTDLVKKITSERRNWDVERAQLNSKINQLDEQLSVFIHAQSRSKDTQYRMEIAWEKERAEQKRLLTEAHQLAMDLQEQLQRRDEEHARERRNLLDQLESHQTELEDVKNNRQRMSLELRTEGTRVKHVERQMEDMREKHQQENDFWVKEKGDLLRRLAEMRKLHVRDVRRIDDVLAALKRLRELASIVVESDTSATLPSNGNDVSGTSGDASAASASVTSHEPNEISDLKENIDQVILKYVKESLRQIHFVAEELARPTADFLHEEKQKMRRSLSSSEIELLKDEFLLGPQGPGIPFSYHEAKPEVKLKDSGERRETPGVQRHVTHEGSHVTFPSNGIIPSDSLENNVMEQSSFYNDDRDTKVEVHRIKQTRDVTRVETKITTLPKPPPSFIIPRSRSTSPAPQSRTKLVNPVLKTMTLDTTSRSHRLYTPLTDVNSRSSSADSSPVGTSITPSFVSASNGSNGLYGAGPLESGSLDRLSPQTARRRFFESQPSSTSSTTVSWSERRKREANPNRNSRSSTELYASESVEHINGAKGHLRNSVSMDDGVINLAPEQEISATGNDVMPRVRSVENTSGSSKHHSGLRDIISAMKRKFKPKIKRSQSAREYDKGQRLNVVKETEFHETELAKVVNPALDDAHVTQEQLTPIKIPDNDENREKTSKKDKKSNSSPSKSSMDADKEEASSGRSTLQRIKKRFRSRSADRGTRDHVEPHVRPILVGHSSATAEEDGSWRYSETGV
ncbi:myosin-11-like isoform X2 [Dreissena polymorpha]|uniref:myosin-11-like isoform X2 n=1 Tax=Dreissena polymorpha TaxID=45954 RepID=UPI002264B622|nr:myosin-11-like isoform X2 [Dreissena polymorpha]